MSIRMHTTFHLGSAPVESSVGEAVRVAIGMAVDMMERNPDQPCQLNLDTVPKPAKTCTAGGKDATHLLNDEVGVIFDPQVRGPVVGETLAAIEEARCTLPCCWCLCYSACCESKSTPQGR